MFLFTFIALNFQIFHILIIVRNGSYTIFDFTEVEIRINLHEMGAFHLWTSLIHFSGKHKN